VRDGGDTAVTGSLTRDTLYFKSKHFVQGINILINRAGSTKFTDYYTFDSDTTLGNNRHLSTYGYVDRSIATAAANYPILDLAQIDGR